MINKFFLFIVFMIFSSVCFAEQEETNILSLDLNLGNAEQKVLADYAAAEAKRGHKVNIVTIPEVSAEERANYQSWSNELEAMTKSILACNGKKDEKCRAIQDRHNALDSAISGLFNRHRLSPKQIEDAIRKATSTKSFDRIFLSGHDGTGDFYGSIGNFPLADFKNLVRTTPNLSNSVRGLYFWGCYTNPAVKDKCIWSSLFPHAEFVAGYDSQSPRADRPENRNILKGLMKDQDLIVEKEDSARSVRAIVSGAAGLYRDMSDKKAAIYLPACQLYYYEGSLQPLDKVVQEHCGSELVTSKYEKFSGDFDCYFNAKPGCEDVPSDTNHSPLRDAYNFLQENELCFADHCVVSTAGNRPDTGRTVRLIFYKNIVVNAERESRRDVTNLNNALKALHAPQDLLVPDYRWTPITRKLMLDWHARLRIFLSSLPYRMWPSPTDDTARKLFSKLERELIFLDPVCVPFGWVEPDAHIGRVPSLV